MAQEIRSAHSTRRYVRVRGPFDGHHLDTPRTEVLIYDLNVGGGFVNFGDEQPAAATLRLNFRNLTDRDYYTRGFGSSSVIPGDPFAVYGSVELGFGGR